MDPMTVETHLQMTTGQFITLIVFLVINTAAIAAAWYRFGYRISKVENDASKTRQDILELKAKNTSESHMQLRKEHDLLAEDTRNIAKGTTHKLDAITITLSDIREKLNTHIEIHKDRECNQGRKSPTNRN